MRLQKRHCAKVEVAEREDEARKGLEAAEDIPMVGSLVGEFVGKAISSGGKDDST